MFVSTKVTGAEMQAEVTRVWSTDCVRAGTCSSSMHRLLQKRTDGDNTEHERMWALTALKTVPEDCTQLSDDAAQAAASLQPAEEILVC